MLSGIGPKTHLSEVGIECLNDLPGVGSTLKDHPLNILLYETKQSLEPDVRTVVLSFMRDDQLLLSEEAAELPQEEQRHLARPTVPTYEVAPSFNFPPGAPVSTPNLVFLNFGMTPQSTGTVRPASGSPADAPLCDPKFHTHPYDRKSAILRTCILLDLVKKGFGNYVKSPISAPLSQSDKDVNDWLENTTVSGLHMGCTVKMGPENDGLACVDSFFKVRGVDRLRVADLSVCPFLPSCHTDFCCLSCWVVGC